MSPFTIKTFFPTGDPSGFRISEITRDNIQAFYIPRNNLKEATENRSELQWNGVYSLFDESDHTDTVYIGEAENVGNRLKQHLKENWWSIAVAFVVNNKSHQLSKADIKYLENMMYKKAKAAKTMKIYNANIPHKSFVEESRQYDLHDDFNSIDLLLRSLGFPVFVKDNQNETGKKLNEQTLYLTVRGSNASGIYNKDTGQLTVSRGSKLTDLPISKSFNRNNKLYQLIKDGIIKNNQFNNDYIFSSSSMAACILGKSNLSGPALWHRKDGKSLKELYKNK